MKTFEELEECVKNINKMEEIFRNIAVVTCHQVQIQRYIELKDRVFEILVKDIHRNEAVCTEELAECVNCMECEDQLEKFIDRKLAEGKEE